MLGLLLVPLNAALVFTVLSLFFPVNFFVCLLFSTLPFIYMVSKKPGLSSKAKADHYLMLDGRLIAGFLPLAPSSLFWNRRVVELSLCCALGLTTLYGLNLDPSLEIENKLDPEVAQAMELRATQQDPTSIQKSDPSQKTSTQKASEAPLANQQYGDSAKPLPSSTAKGDEAAKKESKKWTSENWFDGPGPELGVL